MCSAMITYEPYKCQNEAADRSLFTSEKKPREINLITGY